jgi:hypothetical protein
MITTPDSVRLRPTYDADRLQAELFHLGGDRFRPQASFEEGRIVEDEYQGWRVLSLRGPAGEPARADAGGPGLVDYADTPHLRETPYIASMLRELNTPLRAVRFMSLEPGASVGEHTDYPYGLSVGWARLHLPIVTNPGAVIVINGVENRWQPGELWFANFGRPHHLYNNGDRPRVHLVIDCFAGPGLLDLFPPEVRDGIDTADVMLRKPVVPLPAAELEALTGPLEVPATFCATYAEPPTPEQFAGGGEPDVPGRVSLDDQGRLVLSVDGGYTTVLEHLGDLEFRWLCWTEERTVQFRERDGRRFAAFRYRSGAYRTEAERPVPDSVRS